MSSTKPGIYKHFKGDEVKVLGISEHTENSEQFVTYTHNGKLWIRPIAMFEEETIRDGIKQKRFTFLREI